MGEAANVPARLQRVSVPALDAILGEAMPVLDHGFVRVIDYMGDDSSIVQMARTSYGEGTKAIQSDAGLIRYLMRHWHTSPFEGCEIKLHVKMPIFVARQWVRHRTASLNEVSARYSILPNEFYTPDPDKVQVQSKDNKQGRNEIANSGVAKHFLDRLFYTSHEAYGAYTDALDDDIARELARIGLTLNTYTEWYWKIDLHNLLHFLRLRADPHAQWEIRVYAELIIEKILRPWLPITVEAFEDYRLNACQFSGKAMDALRAVMIERGVSPDEFSQMLQDCGVKGGEVKEVVGQLL